MITRSLNSRVVLSMPLAVEFVFREILDQRNLQSSNFILRLIHLIISFVTLAGLLTFRWRFNFIVPINMIHTVFETILYLMMLLIKVAEVVTFAKVANRANWPLGFCTSAQIRQLVLDCINVLNRLIALSKEDTLSNLFINLLLWSAPCFSPRCWWGSPVQI